MSGSGCAFEATGYNKRMVPKEKQYDDKSFNFRKIGGLFWVTPGCCPSLTEKHD